MAKAAKQETKKIENILWDACNKLRGSVTPAEYKNVVLALIFLKFVSDKFEKRRQELIDSGKERFVDIDAFYQQDNIFFLSPESRWEYLKTNAKQPDIALKIDDALAKIEKANPVLRGALPDGIFAKLGIENSTLSSLVDTISKIDTLQDEANDIIGRVYEYFLMKFALSEGKGKGEFYTPKTVVSLICEMIQPYKGKIYDPCAGSGGMFVQSMKFVQSHQGNLKDVSIYGQEKIKETYKLAKMNLAIRGLAADMGETAASTFTNDQHKDLKVDYVITNPPFNLKDWRENDELVDDPRWSGYELPPLGNANYAWILHIVSKLSQNGVAGFLLANGALDGSGVEKAIRQKLIETEDLVEAICILPRNMFYTTDISVTLWILNRNKHEHDTELMHYRNREHEVLFMDLRQLGEPFEKKYIQFSDEQIQQIATTFHNWQSDKSKYQDVPEFCKSVTLDEIREKDFSLVPSRYIEFVNRDENVDFAEKMSKLRIELSDLLKAEEELKSDLEKVLKELGYDL